MDMNKESVEKTTSYVEDDSDLRALLFEGVAEIADEESSDTYVFELYDGCTFRYWCKSGNLHTSDKSYSMDHTVSSYARALICVYMVLDYKELYSQCDHEPKCYEPFEGIPAYLTDWRFHAVMLIMLAVFGFWASSG
jgi:hypothetical protein